MFKKIMKLINIYESLTNNNVVINNLNELTKFIESVEIMKSYTFTIISKLYGKVNISLRLTSENGPSLSVVPINWYEGDWEKHIKDAQCYYMYVVDIEGKKEQVFYSGSYYNIRTYKKVDLAKKALIKELKLYLN